MLSTRVLKQLAMDEKDNFPIAANVVLQDVYLDDILTGCTSIQELELLKTEVILLFKSGRNELAQIVFLTCKQVLNAPDLVKSELWWKGSNPSKLVHAEHSHYYTDDIKKELKTSVTKTLLLSAEMDLFHKIVSVN
ncbi:hypothetical protein HNY73_023169 [Argiope bruennichi]|uniref:Uncharacterized protein n=1 Tax=Argiope bruennichi TaxID=94029 RepID=A0A8T0E5Q3_ARGBR|nr:hypothetical protein HNY73_023169 [Argiope bruennichi]